MSSDLIFLLCFGLYLVGMLHPAASEKLLCFCTCFHAAQKTTKATAKTEQEGAQGDDVEEKTEKMNDEKATSAKATKKVCFCAVITHMCFTSLLSYSTIHNT